MVDSDGKRIGSVGVTAVATFSQEKGHEGQFLGAELVVDRYVEKGNGDLEYAGRTVIPLNYGQAVHALGAAGISAGAEAATQAAHCFTCEAIKADAKEHPGKYVGIVAGAAAIPVGVVSILGSAALTVVGALGGIYDDITHH